jgi:hypothetical protein
MIQTTPVQDRETRFSCPQPRCAWCNRPGAGHITPRAWTGTHQPSERLRGTACAQECSAREGPVMARRKRPADTGVRWLQGQRWGAVRRAPLPSVPWRSRRSSAGSVGLPSGPSRPSGSGGSPWRGRACHWLRPRPPSVLPRANGGRRLWRGAAGCGAGAPVAPARRPRQPPCSRRSSRGPGSGPGCARRAGRPPRRRCSKSWGAGLVPGGGGTWAGSRRPVSGRPHAGLTPQGSRAAPRLATAWRAAAGGGRWPAPFWPAVAPPATRGPAPHRLYGTVVWHAPGAGGPSPTPPPVSVVEPHAPPGAGLAPGAPRPLCAAA